MPFATHKFLSHHHRLVYPVRHVVLEMILV
jgi:hypothetical protein